MKEIFISHSTKDKPVVDMIVDFIIAVGIPREAIFCSSLPGNDVKEHISSEIRESLEKSIVDIIVLSQSYYQSAYCLNEAGIIWYKNTPIVIALPEITIDNMVGFINKDYKLRRLNETDDISAIVDNIDSKLNLRKTSHQIVNLEVGKLIKKYNDLLKERVIDCSKNVFISENLIDNVSTDAEKIILYYLLSKETRKTLKSDILLWLNENELFNVNIDSAFDLLASIGKSKKDFYSFELDINFFKKIIKNKKELLNILQPCLDGHHKKVSDIFVNLWQRDIFDNNMKLFLLYIVENKIRKLNYLNNNIKLLKNWEENNSLDTCFASNYHLYIQLLVKNALVYESVWNDYGETTEYTIYNSLQDLLLDNNFQFLSELQNLKKERKLPFL